VFDVFIANRFSAAVYCNLKQRVVTKDLRSTYAVTKIHAHAGSVTVLQNIFIQNFVKFCLRCYKFLLVPLK
jgi:hypothetical protein